MPYDITQFSPGYGGIIDSSGNLKNIADGITVSGSQIVVTGGVDQASALKSYTLQSGASALGNGTVADVTGYATITLDFVISGTATVVFEASNDNTNFFSITSIMSSSGSAVLSQATTTMRGLRFSTVGIKYFRAKISSYTSGTVDVSGYASSSSSIQVLPTASYGNNDTNSGTSAIVGTAAFNLLYGSGGWERLRSVSSANDALATGVPLSGGFLYNGTTWDRFRNNISGTALASAARTGTTVSSDLVNYNHSGVVVSLYVTAASGTGGLQVAIQMKDTIGNVYRQINATTSTYTSTGQYVFMLYPGIDAVNSNNNQNVSQVLPQQFRIQVTHGDASSYTYSVNYQMIL